MALIAGMVPVAPGIGEGADFYEILGDARDAIAARLTGATAVETPRG